MRPTRDFQDPAGGDIHLSATAHRLPDTGPASGGNSSSATWTASSGELGFLSDTDAVEERSQFVQEYNRLATKHGIRSLAPVRLESASVNTDRSPSQQRKGWFSRTFLRQPSTTASHDGNAKPEKRIQHKRSVSDLAMHLVKPRKESLKDEDLQSLVRLCGRSTLHMPADYAPSALVLPTCFRATAQYLVQHGTSTRGLFRIPGSVRVVTALYEYYCAEQDADSIASTTRCPSLPLHIKAGVHDVASTFKKLLAGLPGGILGSLPLFDALVAIHSQLHGDIELGLNRNQQSRLRSKLICLAIGTVKSQYRRELICAVFGLLSLIGRAAEKAPGDDDSGTPRPTSDLMGYDALGIVFGPLLVGDLVNSYTMGMACVDSGFATSILTPPKLGRERRKSRVSEESAPASLAIDRIHVANGVTEMVASHWREVVTYMRRLRLSTTGRELPAITQQMQRRDRWLRPIASETFSKKKPTEWYHLSLPTAETETSESALPQSTSPSPSSGVVATAGQDVSYNTPDAFLIRRQRSNSAQSTFNTHTPRKALAPFLSPAPEEPTPVGPNVRPAARSRFFASPPRVRNGAASEGSLQPCSETVIQESNANHGIQETRKGRKSLHTSEDRCGQSPINTSRPHGRGDCDPSPTRRDRGTQQSRGRGTAPKNPRSSGSLNQSHHSQRSSLDCKSRGTPERGGGSGVNKTPASYRSSLLLDADSAQGVTMAAKVQNSTTQASRRPSLEGEPPGVGHLPGWVAQRETSAHEAIIPKSSTNARSVFRGLSRGPLASARNAKQRPEISTSRSSEESVRASKTRAAPFDGSPEGRVRAPGSPVKRMPQDSGIEVPQAPTTPVQEPVSRPTAMKTTGNGVKAMAALFEKASKNSEPLPTPTRNQKYREGDTWLGNGISQYTTSSSLSKSVRSAQSNSAQSAHSSRRLRRTTVAGEPSDKDAFVEMVRGRSSPRPLVRERRTTRSLSRPSQDTCRVRTQGEDISPPVSNRAEQSTPIEKEYSYGMGSLGSTAARQEGPGRARQANFVQPVSVISPGGMQSRTPNRVPIPQPVKSGTGTSPNLTSTVLHAQAKRLRKSPEVRVHGRKSLCRQVEALENLDIAALREQLCAARAECETWRERAEAAEWRVTALERCVARNEEVREKREESDAVVTPVPTKAVMRKPVGSGREPYSREAQRGPHHGRASSTPADDDGTAAEHVRRSFQAVHDDGPVAEFANRRQPMHVAADTGDGADVSNAVDSDSSRGVAERELLVNAAGIWVAAQGLLDEGQ